MKSNEEGTKIKVFVLCTADLRTDGSVCTMHESSGPCIGKARTHLGREVLKPLVRFRFWKRTVKLDKFLVANVDLVLVCDQNRMAKDLFDPFGYVDRLPFSLGPYFARYVLQSAVEKRAHFGRLILRQQDRLTKVCSAG